MNALPKRLIKPVTVTDAVSVSVPVSATAPGGPPVLRVLEPGRYVVAGHTEALRRLREARRTIEDRRDLIRLGLLDP